MSGPPLRRILQTGSLVGAWLAALVTSVVAFAHGFTTGLILAILLLVLAALALDAFFPAIGRGAVRRGRPSPGAPRVALTFDDGPSDDTPAVLDALAQAGVKATFFVLGQHAQQYPALVQRAAREGHLVGNHTRTHRVLTFASPSAVAAEIDAAQRDITACGVPPPFLFRAPRGFQGPHVRRVLRERGLRMVAWTRGAWDSERREASVIAAAAAANPRDGDILLLHDGAGTSGEQRRDRTAQAIPLIVDAYRRRGFQFVTLREMLGAREPARG